MCWLQRRLFSFLIFALLSVNTGCGLALAQPPAPAGATVDDGKALNALREQLKDADPQAAIDAYRKFYESRPTLDPNLAISLTMTIADIYNNKLNDPKKLFEIDDWAIQKYAQEKSLVWLLEHKIRNLNKLQRHEEASKVWEDNWEAVVRAGRSREDWLVMYAAVTLRQTNDAYEALGKPEKAIAMILKGLNEIPALLDLKAQGQGGWKNGWMYDSIATKLLKAGRADEALGWAKLQYMECGFDKDGIAQAIKLLGQVWAEQEAYAQVRAFAQAQEEGADPAVKNPLATTKLPILDEKAAQEQVTRLQTPPQKPLDRGKVPELINVLIARGDFAGAMSEAQRLLKDNPASPMGATQICRVFKAADLNTRRANQFLLFLDGKAENPIAAFLKEQAAKTTAPAAAATP